MPAITDFPTLAPLTGAELVPIVDLEESDVTLQNKNTTIDVIAAYVLSQDSSAGGVGSNAFGTIAVSGQSDVVADQANDTLTLVAGSNVTITTNAAGDSLTIAASGSGSGAVVQMKNFQTGAVATGSTIIPVDDTIPQNTEGDEYMTLAITPTSASNKLKIDVVVTGSFNNASRALAVALFQDSTANALAAVQSFMANSGGSLLSSFSHYMTAGTTSSTTFKVRAGPNAAATFTLNGGAGSRLLGGVGASSITITEVTP